MTRIPNRAGHKASRRAWITLVLGVIALCALVLPGVATADGSGLASLTRGDLEQAGFTCEVHNINGDMVVCTKGTTTFVCDKDGRNCVQAPLPGSKLNSDDLKKDGYACKFHNVSGGMVICTKGTTTYICDKFGNSCAQAPFGGAGVLSRMR
jgi:hypothetical protein